MARAYGDDLRRKLLDAHERGVGSLAELAGVFGVSVGWAKKISLQRKRTGHMERVIHRPGRKPHVNESMGEQVKLWFSRKPDLTLAEVQSTLWNKAGIRLSLPQIWLLVKKLGLRLKKSRSTPPSATRKPTSHDAKSSSRQSALSRRRG